MTDNPSSKTVNNILSAFPQVNREWLLKGEGDMFIEPEESAIDEVVTYKMLYEAKKEEAESLRNEVAELREIISKEHVRTFALTEEVTKLSRLVLMLNHVIDEENGSDEIGPEMSRE